jgi:hypothetical protein
MAVRSSISRFPVNLEEQESSGLPWGITVTPFAATDERGAPPIRGGADGGGRILPRCEHCWAYFSTYCDLENWAWNCALCGNYNGLTSDSIKRFSSDCPELSSSFIDLELEPTGKISDFGARTSYNSVFLQTSLQVLGSEQLRGIKKFKSFISIRSRPIERE